MTGTPRIFISHATPDSAFAEHLATDLRRAGADVWIDITHLAPTGGDFIARLSAALDSRDVLILILSSSALASRWVPDEMNVSIARYKAGGMRAPLIVEKDPVPQEQIPGMWIIYNRIDAARLGYDQSLPLIYAALGMIPPTQSQTNTPAQGQTLPPRTAPFVRFLPRNWQRIVGIMLLAVVLISILVAAAFFAMNLPLFAHPTTNTNTPSPTFATATPQASSSRTLTPSPSPTLTATVSPLQVGSIVEFPIPTPNSGTAEITFGPEDSIWFTEQRANKIGELTSAGVFQEFPIPTPNAGPSGIAEGTDGNIWFGEYNANQIGRLTPSGTFTEFPTPTPDSNPGGLALGHDGNIWFTEDNVNQIGRITPDGAIREYPIPTGGGGPGEITAGPGGDVWFTEIHGNNIGSITPDGVFQEFPFPLKIVARKASPSALTGMSGLPSAQGTESER